MSRPWTLLRDHPLSADHSDRPQSQRPIKRPPCTPCAFCLGGLRLVGCCSLAILMQWPARRLNATGPKHERGKRFPPAGPCSQEMNPSVPPIRRTLSVPDGLFVHIKRAWPAVPSRDSPRWSLSSPLHLSRRTSQSFSLRIRSFVTYSILNIL